MDVSLIDVEKIEAEWLRHNQVSLDVLRLDKIDPVISGNKWFKLKYYLKDAIRLDKSVVATFGGAWSNHIIATAAAARQAGLKSVGIIRGEKPKSFSNTIIYAMENGMEIDFLTREQYKRKEEIMDSFSDKNWHWINEGGYGETGAKGASEILNLVDISAYSHIVAAVGTGTMLSGLILSSRKDQKVIGISSMKGNYALEYQIKNLIAIQETAASFEIKHDYHFGGYGKHPEALISFINNVYIDHDLPLDIIYTGKTFFAIKDMTEKKLFKPGSKVLMIHSGGLQGNRSLPAKVLAF